MIADFYNRTIVITGATGHLGKAFAQDASKSGARCILIDHNEDDLNELLTSLNASSKASHQIYAADFTQQGAVEAVAKNIVRSHHRVDTLVNNAAFTGDSDITGWATDFENQSVQAWQKALQVNLVSGFTLAQQLMPVMAKSDNASIINISSIYGSLGPDYKLYEDTKMQNPAAYGASKAGMIQLTKWLAATMGPNIRVNAISPGGIYRQQDKKFVERYVKKTILGRMASEQDIVPAMIFLASEHARYITGQNIIIDGGYSIL